MKLLAIQNTAYYSQPVYRRVVSFAATQSSEKNTDKIILSSGGYFAPEVTFEKQYERVVNAMADFWIKRMNQAGKAMPVIVAFDESPLSKKYLPRVIEALNNRKIDVYTHYDPLWKELPLPLGILAYFTKYFEQFKRPEKEVAGSILLSAGSRAWKIGGIRFISSKGSLLSPKEISEVGDLIQKPQYIKLLSKDARGFRLDIDLMRDYYSKYLKRLVNMGKINTAKTHLFYDPRHGATKDTFQKCYTPPKRLNMIHTFCDTERPLEKMKGDPALSETDLKVLSKEMKESPQPDMLGLGNNGDGSQFRVLDEDGKPLSHSEGLLLLLYHLVENKKRHGVLVKSHNTSYMLDELANIYGLPVIDTPTSFNQVVAAGQKSESPVLLHADGQGGVSPLGHLPIKDGFMANFLILELLAYAKKPVRQILDELKNRLSRHYSHTRYTLQTRTPSEIMGYFKNLSHQGGRLALGQVDVPASKRWAEWLKQEYGQLGGSDHELKLFFKNGNTLVIRKPLSCSTTAATSTASGGTRASWLLFTKV